MSNSEDYNAVTLDIKGYVGIITINLEKKLNALTEQLFTRIAELLEELAANSETYVTLVTGRGRFFSAGADIAGIRLDDDEESTRKSWLQSFVSNGFYNTRMWYTHPKILVTALNGPVVGLSAALVAYSDFIYAAPHAYLLAPFSSLGLVAEGGASRVFVNRMGLSLANEALIMGRKLSLDDLLRTGFVNKVIEEGGGNASDGIGFDDSLFLAAVMKEIDSRLGNHLVKGSIQKIKTLMRREDNEKLDTAVVKEVVEGVNVFVKGIPQKEFKSIKSGRKRHKL